MKKIYKEIENGINYLVIEDNDYSIYINIIINHFWYKISKKYQKNKDIKFIISDKSSGIIVYYFHNGKEHNIYKASYSIRDISTSWHYNRWFIYGEEYTNMVEWEKKRNVILRAKKIQTLNTI